MSISRIYVGLKAGTLQGEVFKFDITPTITTHGDQFNGAIGPFKTMRAANWMADPVKGRMNPHCRTVADAERLAKKYISIPAI